MTSDAERDLDPPQEPVPADPQWEFALGYGLEQCYSYFAEIQFVFMGGPSNKMIDGLMVQRRWIRGRLRKLEVPDILIDAADHALAGISQWIHPSVFTDTDLNRRRRSIRDFFELLQQIVRGHMRTDRRRYYDLGVMFYRVTMCVLAERQISALPAAVHEAWPGLDRIYRRELWRSCTQLVAFVRDEEGIYRPDPTLRDVDDAFRALADYLEPRLADEGPVDEEMLEYLHKASYSTGMSWSVKTVMQQQIHG